MHDTIVIFKIKAQVQILSGESIRPIDARAWSHKLSRTSSQNKFLFVGTY